MRGRQVTRKEGKEKQQVEREEEEEEQQVERGGKEKSAVLLKRTVGEFWKKLDSGTLNGSALFGNTAE